MQYNSSCTMMYLAMDGLVRDKFPDKSVRKAIKAEYKAIIGRAKDIGAKNKLLSSYLMAAYFIAMCRCSGLSPEEGGRAMDDGLRRSKLFKVMMGSAQDYFSPKRIAGRQEWSRQTYERKYENDWVVDILVDGPDYDMGFDYRECGVVKLCRDEGCPELAQYLCRLDFTIMEIMGIGLKRTMTLAEGGEKCDFRLTKPRS